MTIDLYGHPIPQPDPAHAKALKAILAAAKKTRFGTLTLDLRNPDHHLHLMRTFAGGDGAGIHFPQTVRTLERTKIAHERDGGPKPMTLFELTDPPLNTFLAAAKIIYCDILSDNTTVVVGGAITLLETAQSVSVELQVVDNNTNSTIAKVTPPIGVNQYSTQVTCQGTLTQPPNVTAVLTCVITPVGGGQAMTLVDTCIYQGVETVQSVTVTDPVSKKTPARNYIKIGLNRDQSQQPDCDYWYSYGVSGPTPIVGVAVNGGAQLASGYSTTATPGFSGYLILYRRDSLVGGGACIVQPPNTNFTQWVTDSKTSFTWQFNPDTFKGAPWDQNQTIDLDFFMEFQVQTNSGPAGMGRVRVTSIPIVYNNNAPPNVKSIPSLTFVWGCLPAGTMVGTVQGDMAIEAIAVGTELPAGRDGRTMVVTRTWKGWEKSPLVCITDDRGRAMRLTSEHPVVTEAGMCLASELARGMRALAADGTFSRLVEVERVAFDGPVYNLDVEPADGSPAGDPEPTFVANGLVVGDNQMQGEYSRRAIERLTTAPAVPPVEWALDVENSRRRAERRALVRELAEAAG